MTFSPFSAAELAQATADLLASLTARCTIRRKGTGDDATGGPSAASAVYADLTTNVPCRLKFRRRNLEGDLALVAGELAQVVPLLLYVPLGTDIRADDQVVMPAVTVLAGGVGWPNSGAVSFTGGGGSGAAGTYTASGGVIQSVTMTAAGANYANAPTPVFAGGGTGATASASVQRGAVAGVAYLVIARDENRTTRLVEHVFIRRVGA